MKRTLRERIQRRVVEYLYRCTIIPNSPARNLRGQDMEKMVLAGYRMSQRDMLQERKEWAQALRQQRDLKKAAPLKGRKKGKG